MSMSASFSNSFPDPNRDDFRVRDSRPFRIDPLVPGPGELLAVDEEPEAIRVLRRRRQRQSDATDVVLGSHHPPLRGQARPEDRERDRACVHPLGTEELLEPRHAAPQRFREVGVTLQCPILEPHPVDDERARGTLESTVEPGDEPVPPEDGSA